MKAAFASFLIAACAISTGARAQNNVNSAVQAVACPAPADLLPVHLYGLWQARFLGITPPAATTATLLFEKHPDYAGSVSGGINRDGVKARVAGDVDNGVFTLEESDDGQRISATWNGAVVEGTCGKEISGTWRAAADGRAHAFVLHKVPGWQ